MHMLNFPFEVTHWDRIPEEMHKGETGTARWRTRTFGEVRVRMVEYSPGYRADHWCSKGHVVLCLEGELHTEAKDGRAQVLTPGMSYQVADAGEQTSLTDGLSQTDPRANPPGRRW